MQIGLLAFCASILAARINTRTPLHNLRQLRELIGEIDVPGVSIKWKV